MDTRWLWAVLGGLLLLGGKGMYAQYKQRGIRNHNPGNIRRGANWQGMAATQTDPAFIQFTAPEYGIRALARVLNTYRRQHGLKTIAGIITRWAPRHENQTDAYISAVAGHVGKPYDAPLTDADLLPLIAAIIKHENGVQPYPAAVIQKGIELERRA